MSVCVVYGALSVLATRMNERGWGDGACLIIIGLWQGIQRTSLLASLTFLVPKTQQFIPHNADHAPFTPWQDNFIFL